MPDGVLPSVACSGSRAIRQLHGFPRVMRRTAGRAKGVRIRSGFFKAFLSATLGFVSQAIAPLSSRVPPGAQVR